MSTSGHETVGNESDNGAATRLHDPNEAVAGGPETTPGEQLLEADSAVGGLSELESVEGFDTGKVAKESLLAEEQPISAELLSLPPAETLAYEEPETVCGSDDRVQISPATAVPWRWNCELIITMANGSTARGTGWLIGPRTVMTAGHVVYSAAAGGWAPSSRGEFHPPALTDPYVNLSVHTALVVLVTRLWGRSWSRPSARSTVVVL